MVKMPLTPDNLRPGLARLLKKAHLLRCARSPRSNVSVNTPTLVDFSRASHLDLFEQPGIRVFQQSVKMRPQSSLSIPDVDLNCNGFSVCLRISAAVFSSASLA